jgi:hypothetical protein
MATTHLDRYGQLSAQLLDQRLDAGQSLAVAHAADERPDEVDLLHAQVRVLGELGQGTIPERRAHDVEHGDDVVQVRLGVGDDLAARGCNDRSPHHL